MDRAAVGSAAATSDAGVGRQVPPHRDRRIRLGYVSADFGAHTIMATHLLSVFGLHDAARFEVFCFSLAPSDGSRYRGRIERDCEHFVDLHTDVSHVDAAARIAAAGLDLLVDLNGFTAGARPAILALRPARFICTYLGFAGSMGAEWVDYVVTTRVITPPRLEHLFTEVLAYLPAAYLVNDHRQSLADVTTAFAMAPEARGASREAAGLPRQPTVVYCAFHESNKIGRAVFATWMEILRLVPGSVLWLLKRSESTDNRLQAAAAAAGIEAKRIVFAPRVGKSEHVQRTALADIFLDTPVNAGGTGADSLWAGPFWNCVRASHSRVRTQAHAVTACSASCLPPTPMHADRHPYRHSLWRVNDLAPRACTHDRNGLSRTRGSRLERLPGAGGGASQGHGAAAQAAARALGRPGHGAAV